MVIPPTVRWIDMQNYGQASMIMQAGAPRTDASPSVRCRCDGNRCSDPPVRASVCDSGKRAASSATGPGELCWAGAMDHRHRVEHGRQRPGVAWGVGRVLSRARSPGRMASAPMSRKSI